MAGKKLSTPDVYEKEIDLSEITVPAGTSTGALLGCFPRGRANYPTLVTSDKDFIENFGQPVLSGDALIYGYGAYAALQFLNESGALYVIRATDPTEDFYANVGVSTTCQSYSNFSIGASAGNLPDRLDYIYSLENASMSGSNILVGANSPGDWGNDIAITIESVSLSADWLLSYDDVPFGVEISALSPSAMPIANNVFKLSVYKKESTENWNAYYQVQDGLSALAISPIETFYGSLNSQVDGNGNQLYIKDIVNNSSKYIYVDVNENHSNFLQATWPYVRTSANEVIGIKDSALLRLSGGSQTPKTSLGVYYRAWEYFKDDAQYDINIVIVPDYSTNVKQMVAQNVISQRKDCIMVAQVGTVNDTTVQQILNAEKYGYSDVASYVCLYGGYEKYYDKYNSKNIYLPLAIFGAEVIARTDNIADVWKSPAGQGRGVLAVSNQNKIWTNEEISQLIERGINVTRLFNGLGLTIWSARTAQLKKSKLQQISIRRTLLFIRKSIKRLLMQYILDTNNNAKTRLRIWSNIDAFLSTLKTPDGALNNYEVVCSDENNTQQTIDNNELNVDIYLDFVSPIERILLSSIVVKTGVNFAEVRVR